MKKQANNLGQYQHLDVPGSQDMSYISTRSRRNQDNSFTYEGYEVEIPKQQQEQQKNPEKIDAESQNQQKSQKEDEGNFTQSLSKHFSSRSKLPIGQQKFFEVKKIQGNPLTIRDSLNYDNLQSKSTVKLVQKKDSSQTSETGPIRRRNRNRGLQKLDHYVPTQSQKVLEWKRKMEQSLKITHQEKKQQPKKGTGEDFDQDFLDLVQKRNMMRQKLPSIQKSASGNIKKIDINMYSTGTTNKEKKTSRAQQTIQYSLHPRKKVNNSMIANPNQFVGQSVLTNYVFETIIRRNRSGTNRFYPKYDLCVADGLKLLMKAQKNFNCGVGSQYSMFASREFTQAPNYGPDDIVGHVSSNFTGSIFNIYQFVQELGRKQILATVHYQSTASIYFVPRKVAVYIKKKPYKYSDLEMPQGKQGKQIDLQELYSYDIASNKEKIYVAKNKEPVYSNKLKKYCLNFYNKAGVSSVKNIILEGEDGRETLLFVKSDTDRFVLDFGFPFQPKIALGFALSSFNFKWVCE